MELNKLLVKYGGVVTKQFSDGDIEGIINHYPVSLFSTSFGYIMEVLALNVYDAYHTLEELEEAVSKLSRIS
jgi:hypothetical protein